MAYVSERTCFHINVSFRFASKANRMSVYAYSALEQNYAPEVCNVFLVHDRGICFKQFQSCIKLASRDRNRKISALGHLYPQRHSCMVKDIFILKVS